MIVITQPNATEEQIQRIVTRVREFGLEAQISRGASRVIIGVIGPEALLREKPIAAMAGVEAIIPVLKPYKLAARDSRGSSAVSIGGCGSNLRPLLRREQRADSFDRDDCERIRRKNFAGRRV